MWGARDLGSLSHRLGRVWSTESWNMINMAKHHQNISKIKVQKLEHTWAICFQQLKTPSRAGEEASSLAVFFPSFGGITIQNLCIWWGLSGFHLFPPGTQPAHHFSFIPLCEPFGASSKAWGGVARCPLCWLIAMLRSFGLGHQIHSCSLLKWQFVVIPDSQTNPYFLKSVDWVCEHRAHLLTCPRSSTLRA